ncbi:MAG: P1 family peptidase, partial [Bacteroidales bacterium]
MMEQYRQVIGILVMFFLFAIVNCPGQEHRVRETGLRIGVLVPGELNSITDIPGVKVGHVTIIRGDSIRTGVTAILPFDGNIFQSKVPAA